MKNKKWLLARIVGVLLPGSAGAWLLVVAYVTMALFVITMAAIIYRVRSIPIPPMVDDSGAGVWPTPTNAVQEEISGKISANSNGWSPSTNLLAKWKDGPVAQMTDAEMLEELEGVYQWRIETSTDFQNWSMVDDTFTGRESDMEEERKFWMDLHRRVETSGARFFRAWHP